ncbi:TPA: hypothetical protein ACGR6T_004752 [Klebsiella aerogenes]
MIKYLKEKAVKIYNFHTSFYNCILISAKTNLLCLILMVIYLGLSRLYAIQINDIDYSAIENLRSVGYYFAPYIAICLSYIFIAFLGLPSIKGKDIAEEKVNIGAKGEVFHDEVTVCILVSFCALLLLFIFLMIN